MALLQAQGVTKRYGGLVANNDVTLAIEPGEIRGLIGPNGAGKTTLVNLITGVEVPDAGEIRLQGQSLLGLAPHQVARRGLLRSFQVTRLFGNLTVQENLLTPFLAQGGRYADGAAQAETLLALTTLDRLRDQPAKGLSGGQRALLQVACGFMLPRLACYVLDEPFAGINPVIKDAIIELIVEANRSRGLTFLVVSHEMTVMRRLCHRITVMMEGRIAVEGTLDEVARAPEVIAGYLGKAWT